uniref:Telomere_reg-2 domain-containing protein n=1 Tax=Trichuris muris TaxID=70415 RepID=A0A5S6QV02_TRIMR
MSGSVEWEEFGRLERATCPNEIVQCLRRLSMQIEQGLSPGRFLAVGEKLMSSMKKGVFAKLSTDEQEEYFSLFVKANPADVLLLLSNISPSIDSFGSKMDLRALEVFLHQGLSLLLVTLVNTEQCICNSSSFGALCQAFVRIPECLVAFSNRNVASSKLTAYFRAISVALVKSLAETLSRMKNQRDSSLEFHSLLVGKLCIVGYGKDILGVLVPYLLARTRSEDGILWSRISKRVIVGVPEIAQERVLLDTLEFVTTGDNLYRLIGDAVVTEKRMKLLLTKKLLFVRAFGSLTVPRTIFKYLSLQDKSEGQEMIRAAFLESLDVWLSPSAICLSPIPQRLYLGQVQLLSLRHMKKETFHSIRDEAIQKSMQAFANHLASPRSDIQTLGKVVFQYVCKFLQLELGDVNLSCDANELVSNLQEAMKEEEADACDPFDTEMLIDFECEVREPLRNLNEEPEVLTTRGDSDSDADPTEEDYRLFPQPSYIEQCIEILWNSKKYDEFVGALCSLERLIRRKTPGSHDLAVETVRLLVHLDRQFAFENFDDLRIQCMIACCVKRPVDVAACLCEEVFNRETVLLRKVDALKALQLAACELAWGSSAIKTILHSHGSKISTLDGLQCILAAPQTDSRAGMKVREVVENRFAPIAPKFFYPLFFGMMSLKVDSDDRQLLLKISETLNTFLIFSGHSTFVTSMATLLIRALWPLHVHDEPTIRAMVLYNFLVAFDVVPEKLLATELHRDLPEMQKWVDDVRINDPDGCCRDFACAALQKITVLKRSAATLSLTSKFLL